MHILSSVSMVVGARLAKEYVPSYIFNETLAQGAVPDDWRLANVTLVFKKGGKI